MASEDKSNLVLPAGVFAFIIDASKGTVSTVVGPHQKSLTAGNEVPMRLDPNTDRLVDCSISDSSQRFPTARQGQYIILENPAPDERHPANGAMSASIDLHMGHRIMVPGPASFPLWPMQRATVLDGHVLRTDQYLVVQVYDEQSAKQHKGKGFTAREGVVSRPSGNETDTEEKAAFNENYPTTPGHRFIVKGTEVSFFIPPTGYEVVPEMGSGKPVFVRTAVSLERLEYCILLDESGGRRIEKGPVVVFPSPTETFVTETKGGTVTFKFRALDLDEIKGLYVKVTEDYIEDDEAKTPRKRGDEIFITGKQQRIYFPRPEHSIIRYGDGTLHYGIAIPNGEGRYVLHRISGGVSLVMGPQTFLPNPIEEVIVQRILTSREVALLYPGNREVALANEALRTQVGEPGEHVVRRATPREDTARVVAFGQEGGGVTAFDRGTSYSPPRTITLGGRFDGAVKVNVWPGYAVMVVNGKGARRVVVGPSTTLLEYDETPHRFSLSTGTPKTDKNQVEGVYLQVSANTVSDQVEVETGDLCRVTLTLSYRVNFEGDNPEKWFGVSDYVALLTSTLRSILRKVAKQHGIVELQQKLADIVRGTILGRPTNPGEERSGKVFKENAMRVYDVDVLGFEIQDRGIADLIGREQMAQFSHELKLSELQRSRQAALAKADADKEAIETKVKLAQLNAEAARADAESFGALEATRVRLSNELATAEAEAKQKLATIDGEIGKAELEIQKLIEAQELAVLEKQVAVEVDAYVKRMSALNDKLAAALTHLGDTNLLEAMSRNLSVQQMLGGQSLVEVLQSALGNGTLKDTVGKLLGGDKKV